jgi:hypothetical protein
MGNRKLFRRHRELAQRLQLKVFHLSIIWRARPSRAVLLSSVVSNNSIINDTIIIIDHYLSLLIGLIIIISILLILSRYLGLYVMVLGHITCHIAAFCHTLPILPYSASLIRIFHTRHGKLLLARLLLAP